MCVRNLILTLVVLSSNASGVVVEDPFVFAHRHPEIVDPSIPFTPPLEHIPSHSEFDTDSLVSGTVPSHDEAERFLLVDEDGNSLVQQPRSRSLSAYSAGIGTFGPLDCNPTDWSTTNCDTLVSNNLPSGTSPLTIPCGQCYTFDIPWFATFLGGIDIKGKLVFPRNHYVQIYTPFVIVQGELEIVVDHSKITPDNMATNFIMTGTSDVLFRPSDSPNNNVCPNGSCNLGKKPFVVAGGKVNIHGFPDSCSTHTPVLKKVYKDPVYDPNDFPQYATLPPSCPISGRDWISYNFDSSYGNFTGGDGTFMVLDDGAVTVQNRLLQRQGPRLDLTPIFPSSCLVANQEYLFTAR